MGRHNTITPMSRRNRLLVAAFAALAALFVSLLVGQPFVVTPAHAASASTGTGGLFQSDQVRIFDSRHSTYGYPIAKLSANKWQSISVEGSQDIPATGLSAVQVTFTVLDQSAAGYLYADKGATSTPSTAVPYATFGASDTVSNTAVLPVGSNGAIQVELTSTADLIVDVQGYYSNGATDDGGYVPTSATQIYNSGSTKYAAGQSVTFAVAGTSPIPANASGVMLDIIEANGGSTGGYLTAYPAGTTQPTNSLDWPAGQNYEWSTAVDLTAATAGRVTVTVGSGSASVNLSVGVEGYFTANTGPVDSGQFTPGNAKVLDNTTIGAGATQVVQIGGSRGVPMMGSGITAAAINLEVHPGSGATGNITAYASNVSGGQSAQQYYSGDASFAFDVVKLGPDGAIKVTNNSSASIVVYIDTEGWFTSVGAAIPSGQTSTQQNVTLQGTETSGGAWVTYEYRNGITGSFSSVPVGDVAPAPGSNAPTVTSWPVQDKTQTPISFYPYTWNVQKTLASTSPDGAFIQVEACFGSSQSDTNPVCSMPADLNYEPTAFGDASDTTDIGPGSLSLLTGDFQISSTDASIASSIDGLSVGRSLTTLATPTSSNDPTDVFGPGWSADLDGPGAGDGNLTLSEEASSGYELFTAPDGSTQSYAATTSLSAYPISFTATGDAVGDGSSVSKTSASTVTMTDADGTLTTWSLNGTRWVTTSVAEAGSNTTSTYTADGNGFITRILGPVPSGVDCSAAPDTTPGCRSLKLGYTTTTVNGSNVTRLTSISQSLPTSSSSVPTQVASYDYNANGQLVDVYDPRITPHLLTSYSYDSSGRLATLTPPGEAAWSIAYDSLHRVSTVSRPDPSGSTAVNTVVYNVPTTGISALPDLSQAANWGETGDLPVTATAIFSANHVPTSTDPGSVAASDWPYASIDYLDVNGQRVNQADFGESKWLLSTSQYDANGDDVWDLSAENRDQVLTAAYDHAQSPQLSPPTAMDPYVATIQNSAQAANLLASSTVYNSLDPYQVTDTYGPTHPITLSDGSTVQGQDHTATIYDEGAPADGVTYDLPTTTITDVINAKTAAESVYPDARITHHGYAAINSGDVTGWALRQATSQTIQMGSSPSSADLTSITRYNSSGQKIETRLPGGAAGNSAQDTVITYYGATGTGPCVNVLSAGLACSSGPAAQPNSGNPLAVTTYAYDVAGNMLTETETAGSTVRTTTNTYDSSGRELTSGISVTPAPAGGTALPTVSFGYDSATGVMTSTSTGSGSSATMDVTTYNNIGEETAYTDSTGNTSTVTYDLDGRPTSMSNGKTTASYSYDSSSEHRGYVTSENLNIAGMPSTFSATYNGDGSPSTETYPNGLVSTKTYDNTGAATNLNYQMGNSSWMAFSKTRGMNGQIVAASSPMSSQNFAFDGDDRLTTVQDSVTTGSNQVCTTRQYGFDSDSNRTSLATSTAAANSGCSTPSSSQTTSAYDTADRLTNAGYVYDTLGRTTTVPAADANGIGQYAASTGNLTVGYYVNDMVSSESQGGTTLGFTLDPEQNRILSTTNGTTVTTNHYSDDTDNASWVSTGGSSWTSYLTDITGGYAASVDQTGAVTLELTNMDGAIVATALDSNSDTGIQAGSYSESTEYGAPRAAGAASSTFGWLGTSKRSLNSLGGLVLMGVRLYNPATGRFLSADPMPGGNANAYVYPDDPINSTDISGEFSYNFYFVVRRSPLTAAQVMKEVKQHFGQVFPPLSWAPKTKLGGVGQRIWTKLNGLTWNGVFSGHVDVVAESSTGWEFHAEKDHPDAGGYIHFDFYKTKGIIKLHVWAYIPHTPPMGGYLYDQLTRSLWGSQFAYSVGQMISGNDY